MPADLRELDAKAEHRRSPPACPNKGQVPPTVVPRSPAVRIDDRIPVIWPRLLAVAPVHPLLAASSYYNGGRKHDRDTRFPLRCRPGFNLLAPDRNSVGVRRGLLGMVYGGRGVLQGLQINNSKAYWSARKAFYEASAREPVAELLGELSGEFGPGRISRPCRDVRFRADKAPYKTEIYATLDRGGYVKFSADELTPPSATS
jgi:hypothetical protein